MYFDSHMSEFLILGTVDVWIGNCLLWGLPCVMSGFISHSGLCPLEDIEHPLDVCKNVSQPRPDIPWKDGEQTTSD